MKEDRTFLTRDELTDIIDAGKSALLKMVKRGKIERKFIKYVPGLGRGGKQLKIDPAGLPEPYRTQWMQHEESRQLEVHQGGSPLPDWAVDYASARLDIIHLLQRELQRAKKAGKNITPVYDETADMYNSGHVLEEAFQIVGKTSATSIRRWLKTYDKAKEDNEDVIEALSPDYNTNKGNRSVPGWYQKRLTNILLHPNCINPSRGIKIVNMNLRREGTQVPCSERTAQRWIDDYKDKHYDRWILMRKGQKALNDQVLPYLDRDWNLLSVGQVLIADGHVLNFDVKHPKTGRAHRPVLICFYDGRSRMPVGLSIMPTENTDSISEALVDGIRTLGKKPDAVILDNGRAFKGKYFTKSADFDDSGLAGLYERHGILSHFTKPYHGQSKPIEPFFNQLNERFSKMLPTYRGASIDTKVARLKRNEKEHVKAYEEQVGDWLPTIPDVLAAIKHWSFETYGIEEHGGLRKGETPRQVLEAGQGPGVAYHELLDMMLTAKQVRPRRARFRLEGIVYENWDELTGWNKPVLVRYTRRVPDKVWVFDNTVPAPEFMCIAQAVKAVHPLEKLTNDDGDFDPTIRERLKQRKKLEKRAKRNTEELRKINGDIAEPIGRLMPGDDNIEDYEIGELPDATPNERAEAVEIEPMEFSVSIDEEEDEEQLFEYAYERFEHIAQKDHANIDADDIEFLKDFTTSESYNDLYAAQHGSWVQELINKSKDS